MNELRKLNEQQVNMLLTQAIDQAWESICITDVQLEFPGPRFVYVNHGYEKIMGYTSEEAIGQTPRIQQGPLTDRKVLERLKQNLKRGEPFHGETINYRKDGQAFWLEWKIYPVRNGAGVITNFIAFQRDISELKAAEQRVKDFYSILSHELRSPLTSILGSLKLLAGFKMDPNSDTGKELTSIAIDSTERLVRLINELLDLTKLEQGDVNLDLKRTTADALIVTAANNMVSFQAQHHVKIDTSTIKADVAVDPDKIVQVLVNLISNAMKFSPPGGTVKVSVKRTQVI
jgi:PAS domain S-box-containing protein